MEFTLRMYVINYSVLCCHVIQYLHDLYHTCKGVTPPDTYLILHRPPAADLPPIVQRSSACSDLRFSLDRAPSRSILLFLTLFIFLSYSQLLFIILLADSIFSHTCSTLSRTELCVP